MRSDSPPNHHPQLKLPSTIMTAKRKHFTIRPENRAAYFAKLEAERMENRAIQLPRWIESATRELESAIADNEPDWYVNACREKLAKFKA